MKGTPSQIMRVSIGMQVLLVTALVGCAGDSSTEADQNKRQGNSPQAQAETDAARRERMLVDREKLESMLGQSGVRVVDTRALDEYLAAHIPGAVHVDVAAWQGKGLEESGFDDAEFWAGAIGKLGIGNDTKVVVYGSSPTNTARIWWHLAYAGVKQAMILDGGWDLWKVGGKPTEMDAVSVEAANFQPKFDKSLLMTKEQVQGAIDDSGSGLTILDTRSTDEFTGRLARGGRGGHLPGAVHCEFNEMLDSNGRYKSNEEIRAILAERDVGPDGRLVTHCQSGGRASLELFALRMAGYENVANFYGGWSEWSQDAEAPVEK